MVFVWSTLTKGNPAYTVVQVATNDLIILIAFVPIVKFLLANAILDRLLHHSHVVKVVGPSYRTKDYYELLDAEEQKTGR